jgi:hypothetical protein
MHLARIGSDDVVDLVEYIGGYTLGDAIDVLNLKYGYQAEWIETSFRGLFRKQYAQVGMTYDRVNDAFISKKPYRLWIKDSNLDWIAPKPMPELPDGAYCDWNDNINDWEIKAR